MFSTYDCAVKGIRKKEDPYNSIIAGFLTGGSLAIRGGYKAARNGAIMCAIFLAVIEGVGIGIQRLMAENTRLDVSFSFRAGKVRVDILTSRSFHLLNHPQNLAAWQRDSKWPSLRISFEISIGYGFCRTAICASNRFLLISLLSSHDKRQLFSVIKGSVHQGIAGVQVRTVSRARVRI